MAELYLHSLTEFSSILCPLIEELAPKSVLEIGSETGVFTDWLQAYCDNNGAKLTTVEPCPTDELVRRAERKENFLLAVDLSLHFMKTNDFEADLALIDGDHNYFTVSNELKLLHESWKRHSTDGVAFLHDVGWPCARRDFYYAPKTIPKEHCWDHTYQQGVTLQKKSPIAGGLRGEGNFAVAIREGGKRNGVLTAVEDFLKRNDRYAYYQIDAVLGLGAIATKGSDSAAKVERAFAPYNNDLIRKLEKNRLELYLKVIELQDILNRFS